jgi:HPr kinase/phosphorylase
MARKMEWKILEVPVSRFVEAAEERLGLELIAGQAGMELVIAEAAINRGGLAVTGFFDYFANRRIQVLGLAEYTYLSGLDASERATRLREIYEHDVPCVVVTRDKEIFPELETLAEEFKVPLLRTGLVTMNFINSATILMENLMAPRVKVQGTMVEIMGVGVLIEGRSGLGKSETALSLIRKGHSLVADDVTNLRRDSSGSVVASAIGITRFHMEIGGLGIIHVPSIFGIASVREQKRLDLVVSFRRPGEEADDELLGQVHERDVLGVPIPQVNVIVDAGRNLANVVEAAALNQKLRRLGHDAEKELDARLVSILSDGGMLSD